MCGIAGIISSEQLTPDHLQHVFSALAVRGPDARGHLLLDGTWRPTQATTRPHHALLHSRLSIRDPRPLADQPMQIPGRNVWICYNGEVYGWEAQADQLRAAGADFRSHSDTEFILQGYAAWGFEALLSHLRGMFAIAILDLEQRKLWLARDRMGLKPLVYFHDGKQFAFASLVRAIIPLLPKNKRQLNPASLDAYLAHRYIPAPHTALSSVLRLENGYLLKYDLDSGHLEKQRYWQPEPKDADVLSLLDESIRLRTVADRPVGLFLSGGIDSTVIASRLAAQGFHNIKAFTAAFPGSTMDESDAAAKIAAKLGLPHTAVEIPARIETDFDRIVSDFDEPFADPSGFPLWYLARAASQEVKVVLNGDGGDELFAGYKRYAKHARSGFRGNFHLPFLPVRPSLAAKGASKLLAELSMTWQEAYGMRFSGFTINQRMALQATGQRVKPTYWRNFPSKATSPLEQMLDIDHHNYLPEYILRKADLVTMAHGLEGRSPLLDHHLFQAVLKLAHNDRFTDPAKKILEPTCETLGELNPFQFKKRGFNPPLKNWLRMDLHSRFTGLGQRLQASSEGQVLAAPVDRLCGMYLDGQENLAEQILQLLILDSSLTQLRELVAAH